MMRNNKRIKRIFCIELKPSMINEINIFYRGSKEDSVSMHHLVSKVTVES